MASSQYAEWDCEHCTFLNQSSISECEMCQNKRALPSQPKQKGVVTLRNSPSFLNSTIQCLLPSPGLTDFFLSDSYLQEINESNPIGYGGVIAKCWGTLSKDLCSGKYMDFHPQQLQSLIDENCNEQDAHRLLSFLINALHEDLNRVLQKPYIQPLESNNKADDVLAKELWRNHLLRNQSIITDLLSAQSKSTISCADCDYQSKTFQPFTILSVPIPTEKYKRIEYTFIDRDPAIVPTVYQQKMLKIADISMLKESVTETTNERYRTIADKEKRIGMQYLREMEKLLNLRNIPFGVMEICCDYYSAANHPVDVEEVFVADVWKSKIHRELRLRDSISDIDRKSDDIWIYHSPRPSPRGFKHFKEEKEEEKEEQEKKKKKRKRKSYKTFLVYHQHRAAKQNHYSNTAQEQLSDEHVGFPLLITLPTVVDICVSEIYAQLWKLVAPLVTDMKKVKALKELPFKFLAMWGADAVATVDSENEEIFDLNQVNQRNLKFIVYWSDVTFYRENLYKMEERKKDESAKMKVEESAKKTESVPINACLDAFCEEETLSENASWKCPQCKDIRKATKKSELWRLADLLLIHLQRFSFSGQQKDRCNTMIEFPVEGLDLSGYVLDDDAIYDLYAVNNQTKSKYSGQNYSADTRNLYNQQWFHYEESTSVPIAPPPAWISNDAYILFYRRRKRAENENASVKQK